MEWIYDTWTTLVFSTVFKGLVRRWCRLSDSVDYNFDNSNSVASGRRRLKPRICSISRSCLLVWRSLSPTRCWFDIRWIWKCCTIPYMCTVYQWWKLYHQVRHDIENIIWSWCPRKLVLMCLVGVERLVASKSLGLCRPLVRVTNALTLDKDLMYRIRLDKASCLYSRDAWRHDGLCLMDVSLLT